MLGAVCLLVLGSLGLSTGAGSTYYLGTGRHDITGPSVQIEMVRTLYFMPWQWGFTCSSLPDGLCHAHSDWTWDSLETVQSSFYSCWWGKWYSCGVCEYGHVHGHSDCQNEGMKKLIQKIQSFGCKRFPVAIVMVSCRWLTSCRVFMELVPIPMTMCWSAAFTLTQDLLATSNMSSMR